jgi:hypothetical protein
VQAIIDSQNALPERDRNPVETYGRITQALARITHEKHRLSPSHLSPDGPQAATQSAAQIKSAR